MLCHKTLLRALSQWWSPYFHYPFCFQFKIYAKLYEIYSKNARYGDQEELKEDDDGHAPGVIKIDSENTFRSLININSVWATSL